MIIRIATIAALVNAIAIAPAIAWDNDPASFRADPQAWVRTVLLPGCSAPEAGKEAFCACVVSMLAQQVTEADVVRVNEPSTAKPLYGKATAAAMTCGSTISKRP